MSSNENDPRLELISDPASIENRSTGPLPTGKSFDASYIWKFANEVEIKTSCEIEIDVHGSGRWIVFNIADIGIHGLGEPIEEHVEFVDYEHVISRYDAAGNENYTVAAFVY